LNNDAASTRVFRGKKISPLSTGFAAFGQRTTPVLMKLTRRHFLQLSTGAIAGGVLARGFYEPHKTVTVRREIRLARLPEAMDGLRVVQLSDLHFNPYQTREHLARIVSLANAEHPDLVLLTGDFITAGLRQSERIPRAEHAWPCAEALRGLDARLGTFAVLGNHDCHSNAEVVSEALNSTGKIKVLRNRAIPLERDGARVWLAGVDNVTARLADADKTLRGIPAQECTLAAVHEPDYADVLRQHPVDMQFSGHSHGGQIVFPVVGPLYLPRLARKYPFGYYRLGNLQLYTNRGIGMIGVPIRFLCPPEMTVFTLRTAKGA